MTKPPLSVHTGEAGEEVGIVVPAMHRSRGAAHGRHRVVPR
jgi:hypothetical protein